MKEWGEKVRKERLELQDLRKNLWRQKTVKLRQEREIMMMRQKLTIKTSQTNNSVKLGNKTRKYNDIYKLEKKFFYHPRRINNKF